MTFVELETITGDVYEYESIEGVVVYSPFGVFSFDVFTGQGLEGFVGEVPPFKARRLEDGEMIAQDVSFKAYAVDESLFVPVEETERVQLNTAYVVNGEKLVKVGEAEFLRPELVGGEQSNKQVVKVYSHAYPIPHNVNDSMEPKFVLYDDIDEQFQKNKVERVKVVK